MDARFIEKLRFIRRASRHSSERKPLLLFCSFEIAVVFFACRVGTPRAGAANFASAASPLTAPIFRHR
jgi:hypothetical protein